MPYKKLEKLTKHDAMNICSNNEHCVNCPLYKTLNWKKNKKGYVSVPKRGHKYMLEYCPFYHKFIGDYYV